jgi:hypothetical protein
MRWLWITALAARAERAVGNCAGYHAIMDQLSALIARRGAIEEVYDLKRNGTLKPVRRLFYHAENPFTWSSAMYLEAANEGC